MGATVTYSAPSAFRHSGGRGRGAARRQGCPELQAPLSIRYHNGCRDALTDPSMRLLHLSPVQM
jgi:hypothetical protein